MASVNDTFQLELIGAQGGQTVIITHHFRLLAIPVGILAGQALIDSWQTLTTTYLAQFKPNYSLTRLRARHICGTIPLDATAEESVSGAGTRALPGSGLVCPPWFAGVVRERTGLSGRTRRGRWFYPLQEEGDFAQELIDPVVVTAVQAYATALFGRFGAGGSDASNWRLAVHSRKLATPGTQCQNSSTLVEALAVQSALTTQKSRRQRPA